MLHRYRLVASTVSIVLGAAGLLISGLPSEAAAKPATKVAAKSSAGSKMSTLGRPMTASELRQLYSGKTWVWSNGGGYMDPSGRFLATTGKDRSTASFTRGTWQTSNNGRMCFGGVWTTGSKRSQGKTCFTHRIWGDTIYQRKEPSGAWYAFKHSPAREDDEFSKLVQGDRISDQMKQVQAGL